MSRETSAAQSDFAPRQKLTREHLFLSPEWVHETTRAVQAARTSSKDFGKLTEGFSLNLLYLISNIGSSLESLYGSTQVIIFVQLDKGRVRKLSIGNERPDEKIDFTITSDYSVAKRLFRGELNPATSFINRLIKIEPLRRVYQQPRLTANSIVAGNAILRIARDVPTVFPPDD